MIGVGLVGFITIFASSTTASINASIDRSFAGDFVINSGAGTTGGVDPALAQKLNALPQVAAATGESTGAAVILGKGGADHGEAIVIALLGIGNTLALSIFERTRELGVMRAVGMTRRQLRTTIRLESVIVASQGTLLGLLIGVFFGWALVLAQKNQGITVFSVPYLTLIIVILLAALAGVAAAILPSRRAAKLNILRAIVTE